MKEQERREDLELEEILERFTACEEFWKEIYERGQEDASFVLGLTQWPDEIKKMRKGRPCLTENRMLPFVHQVINQIRQARPSIIPKPVDDGADADTAEVLRGTIRNIETISDGESVYDTAARNSVMTGVGWIRVRVDYAGYDTFDQEAYLERVQNPQSVYLDPAHQRQDGSDAKYGFIFSDMPKEDFEEKYPEKKSEGFKCKGWESSDTVRVAEYFVKTYEDKTLAEYEIAVAGMAKRGIGFKDKIPQGATILRERNTQICTIKYAKLTGGDILETGEFLGEYIPLIPVYGFEAYVDGKRTFYSLIHQAKDPQRMLNYWKSASTEVVALQPKAPWVGYVGQFKTYERQWRDANNANFPFLEADSVTDQNGNVLPLPQRQMPPQSSGTMMQEAGLAADAIKAALGMYDASMGAQTPDISGKAIISRQMQGDNATYHFIDNLAVAIRHVGRILVGLIPIIYTGQRIVRIMGEDGRDKLVPLNRAVMKTQDGYKPAADPTVGQIISFDAGKYDVVVEVGASYATKRQETANALVELYRIVPEWAQATGDIFVKNLDGPGMAELAKRIRATMPPELLGDDVEAARLQAMAKALNELQNKLQLTEDALLAKQKNEDFKNQLEAQKVQNDTTKLKIEAAKAEAEIEKIKAEIGAITPEATGILAAAIAQLKAQTDDVVGALDALLTAKEEEGAGAPQAPVNEGMNYVGQPDIGSSA